MMIRLHQSQDGAPVLINPDRIVAIVQRERGGSVLQLDRLAFSKQIDPSGFGVQYVYQSVEVREAQQDIAVMCEVDR